MLLPARSTTPADAVVEVPDLLLEALAMGLPEYLPLPVGAFAFLQGLLLLALTSATVCLPVL